MLRAFFKNYSIANNFFRNFFEIKNFNANKLKALEKYFQFFLTLLFRHKNWISIFYLYNYISTESTFFKTQFHSVFRSRKLFIYSILFNKFGCMSHCYYTNKNIRERNSECIEKFSFQRKYFRLTWKLLSTIINLYNQLRGITFIWRLKWYVLFSQTRSVELWRED